MFGYSVPKSLANLVMVATSSDPIEMYCGWSKIYQKERFTIVSSCQVLIVVRQYGCFPVSHSYKNRGSTTKGIELYLDDYVSSYNMLFKTADVTIKNQNIAIAISCHRDIVFYFWKIITLPICGPLPCPCCIMKVYISNLQFFKMYVLVACFHFAIISQISIYCWIPWWKLLFYMVFNWLTCFDDFLYSSGRATNSPGRLL